MATKFLLIAKIVLFSSRFASHQDNANAKDDDDPEASTSNSLNNTAESGKSIEPSTSDGLNISAITLSSGGRSSVFDDSDLIIPDTNDMNLMDVTKFEAPINLDDDMDLPLEITNVMTIDDFGFGDSQVEPL